MFKRLWQSLLKCDALLLFSIYTLTLIGIMAVASASIEPALRFKVPEYYFLIKHLIAVFAGIAIFLAIINVKVPFYRSAVFLFLVNLLVLSLLVLVLFLPARHGVHRWIPLKYFSLQPSEFAKLIVVLTLAAMVSKKEFFEGKGKYLSIVYVLLYATLIILEPDYGSGVFLLLLSFLILYVGGMKLRSALLFGAGGVVFVSFMVFYRGSSYVIERIQLFLKGPDLQYQVRQSLAALGSGGLFGVSPGESIQKLLFLPEAYTDFIFSIIGEEFGFIGTSFIIFLFLLFLWRGYRVAVKSREAYFSLLAFGLTSSIFLQALINISVVVGVFPPKGIALPFLSYGGSSTLTSFAIAGILMHVWIRRRS